MPNTIKKKKNELIPGTIIECKSGRFIAFYEHRTDIIANGENEADAKKNLKKMYEIIVKHEAKEAEKTTLNIPKSYKTKNFTEKLAFA
jgi:predicted RNase H-like HicB family nuclease